MLSSFTKGFKDTDISVRVRGLYLIGHYANGIPGTDSGNGGLLVLFCMHSEEGTEKILPAGSGDLKHTTSSQGSRGFG